jgi:hypothetical protein
MSTQVQLRRGTSAQNATFTGAPGEVTVDTSLNIIRVHDGTTPGGALGDYLINVKRFGARGDGTTDDTAAFQAALSALGGNPGTVAVPAGNYKITGSGAIFTLAKGQNIVGESLGNAGVGGSRIFYGGAGTLMTLDVNCRLANLQLYGAGTVVTNSVGVAFAANASRWMLDNVKSYYFDYGIYLDTTYIGLVLNAVIADCIVGVQVANSQVNAIRFVGGTIESCTGYGVYVTGGPHTGISFVGTTIEGNTNAGIYVLTTNNSNAFLDAFRVDGCYFEANGDGADAGTDIIINAPYGRAPSITGCSFTNTHKSITLTACQNPTIHGNSFRPGGTLGTRKSLQIAAGVAGATVGTNWYETGAFTPSTDDSGSNTVIYDETEMRPAPLANGYYLTGKDSGGNTVSIIGVANGGKYVRFNCGGVGAGAAAYIFLGDDGQEILRLISQTGKLQVKGGGIITSGTGTPEGNVSGPIGSLYMRTDGGAGTSLYVKETGTGFTGWVGK